MGEIFLALYLFSGIIKSIIDFPIDLTVVTLGITTIFVVKKIFNNPKLLNNILKLHNLLYLILLILALFSFFYAQNFELYFVKTLKLVILTTTAFIYPQILFENKKSLEIFLITLVVIGVLISILMLPIILNRGSSIGNIGLNDASYLSIGRILSVAIIILFYMYIDRVKSYKYKTITLASFFIVAFSLFSSGSRMPILSTIFTLLLSIIYLVVIGKLKVKNPINIKRTTIITCIFLVMFLWASLKGFFNTTIVRFIVLFQGDGIVSASARGRIDRFNEAVSIWINKPVLGQGFGSFGEIYAKGVHDYPHNLFLEVLSELGMVGFIVITILLIRSLIHIIQMMKDENIRKNYIFITVVSLYLITFINSMVSGDINSNRIMFTFLSLIFVLPTILKKNNIKSLKN